MTPTEEKLRISEFNYKVLKDEYIELRKKYDELKGYYDELNDRYIKKLNAYNATVVQARETREDNEELAKENRGLVIKLCITFTLLLACCMFILVG